MDGRRFQETVVPRQPRLLLQGVPLHLIQRGHNREACFFREWDYRVYLDTLGEQARRTECSLHAYVLMTNHVHLLASFRDVHRLPDFIRGLGQQYGQYLNRRRRRCSTVWDGRYRSSPIVDGRYLLVCQRYIELNPVRAGIVGRPEDYCWSSYLGNAGVRPDGLLTPHALYSGLGDNPHERYRAYCGLFGQDLSATELEALRRAANGNCVIGNASPQFPGLGSVPTGD
ncbi:transposase [Massilia sp. YMA4]|uniref:transposase n=1 Tax=Massilia sp. YMA4 TaxID=1593482 RepID=UPI001D0C227C|nr:transposase [Massilia sp. YMA4]